jgi:HK97 family phage portal protein
MKFMGFEFGRTKALNNVDSRAGGWMSIIRESYPGAWQQNIEIDPKENLFRFSAIYACVTGISSDIAKLHLSVMREDNNGILNEQRTGAVPGLIRKPNQYQTRFQFVQHWLLSKLLTGNTYALKSKNSQGLVEKLFILEPSFVTVLVSDSGDVYYQIKQDNLTGNMDVTVPASEIIHDRHACLFHPLVGIGPIYACGYSATMGNAIQQNSAGFFKNKSSPGGILTAPGRISDDAAKRLKEHWDNNYSGAKAGKVAVLGDGLKFERMTVSATDAQLIEQLKWTVEDIGRAFRYPGYKLGSGSAPISNNVEMLNLEYYSGCLQPLIESMESVLDDGLGLPQGTHMQFDLEGLTRMDTESRFKTAGESLKVASINEARKRLNMAPVDGGESVYTQQQYYALSDLVKLRQMEFEQMANPPVEPEPIIEDVEDEDTEEVTRALISRIQKGLA